MINWPKNRNSKNNSFILTSTDIGTMIVNRYDYKKVPDGYIGVGYQLLDNSSFDPIEINLVLQLLTLLRHYRGDGVVLLDCGANVGAFTLPAARTMIGWGNVISIEAQERLFYALAGNITINNLLNARAIWSAVSNKKGTIEIPVPDYSTPSSFGSLELIQKDSSEFIGQELNTTQIVQTITIDSMNLSRLDYLKIDVENMEELVLDGAKKTIKKFKPLIHIEVLKSDKENIKDFVTKLGYTVLNLNNVGQDYLCIPEDDPVLQNISKT